jgi:hypothetical protein
VVRGYGPRYFPSSKHASSRGATVVFDSFTFFFEKFASGFTHFESKDWRHAPENAIHHVMPDHLPRRSFMAASVAVVCALTTIEVEAQVGGEVRLARQSLRERHESWRSLLRFRLPKQPSSPTIELSFRLVQTADFQPGKTPSKPSKVPVDPPREIVQKQEVDMRGIRGEVSRSGRTELLLSRDQGFRAGVWELTVEGPDGPLQAPIALTLEGVNEPSKEKDDKADAGAVEDA